MTASIQPLAVLHGGAAMLLRGGLRIRGTALRRRRGRVPSNRGGTEKWRGVCEKRPRRCSEAAGLRWTESDARQGLLVLPFEVGTCQWRAW